MDKKDFNEIKYSDERLWQIRCDKETNLRINIILDFIGSNKKVLDIGCGNGYIAERIKNKGNDVIGTDIFDESIKLCKSRGIKCIKQDIEKPFRFKGKSFDVILLGELIEHIFDTDKLLQEIKKILKSDGYLILTTPNIAALTRRLNLFFGKNPNIDIGLVSPDKKDVAAGHIRYFTIGSLEKLLNRNDFVIEKWKTDFIALHNLRLRTLASIFPTLGYGLIAKARLKS